MLETRRQYRLRLMQSLGKPFAGRFYWTPSPTGQWDLMAFASKYHRDPPDDNRIWNEVVAILSLKWGMDSIQIGRRINDCPHGLPRGRVVPMANGVWGVFLGSDIPTGSDVESVLRSFHLPANAQVMTDEKEQTIPEQAERVRSALMV